MRNFTVDGIQIGANGVNYGYWRRYVKAENESAAKVEALRTVKAQCGPTAHECEVTNVQDCGEAVICDCCGKYHD